MQPSGAGGCSPSDALAEEVLRACGALGFASAGVVAAAGSSRPERLREWLTAGMHGEMEWMTEHADERVDAGRLLAGAKTVLMVADRYALAGAGSEIGARGQKQNRPAGRVAKYAHGRDYHEVMRKRLGLLADRLRARHKGHEFRLFVDTGPVLEREHAARAGLGFIGKNTLLIDPRAGSYLLLGGMATTLEMTPTAPEGRTVSVDPASHCGGCTRCIDACPTGAITPYCVDARRCISYLTIEHEGPIDAQYHRAMGDWVFGCDVCQDVCPFNTAEHGTGRASVNRAYRPRAAMQDGTIDLMELLDWSPEQRQVRLTVSAGKRASLSMMRRNAVIAAGNVPETRDAPELQARVRVIAGDENEEAMVRQTAAEVVARIGGANTTGSQPA